LEAIHFGVLTKDAPSTVAVTYQFVRFPRIRQQMRGNIFLSAGSDRRAAFALSGSMTAAR
jgi:hypothetical protein